jgi:hypothetical protein
LNWPWGFRPRDESPRARKEGRMITQPLSAVARRN